MLGSLTLAHYLVLGAILFAISVVAYFSTAATSSSSLWPLSSCCWR
jgi:hypothetical protein